MQALEVVFNGGKGKNYIWDALTSQIADEKSERISEVKSLHDFFQKTRDRVESLMLEIQTAE